MFFRLWTRAPCTATVVLAYSPFFPGAWGLEPGAFLLAIRPPRMKKRELLQRHRSLLGGPHRRGHLAQVSLVGQVLARHHRALHVERALEVVLDLAGRPGVAGILQVGEHGPK